MSLVRATHAPNSPPRHRNPQRAKISGDMKDNQYETVLMSWQPALKGIRRPNLVKWVGI